MNQEVLGRSPATAVRPPSFDGIPYVQPHVNARAFWKRTLDLSLAIPFLLITFPAWLIIAACVKLSSKGPVVYKSKRIGLSGKSFDMYKFRSMYTDADGRLKELWKENDGDGPCFKMKNDPRITRVGKFLRRYSLDELPQLFSVLTGESSLVGPRALHQYEVEQFDDFARGRLSVKPGLTCLWQIGGRSNLSFEEWMKLDMQYIEAMSLGTDLRILRKTPRAIIKGDGAF